jgi:hypothetical protein
MSASPSPLRMLDLSGAEALWLLESGSLGRRLCVLRGQPVVRPARRAIPEPRGRSACEQGHPAPARPVSLQVH